MTHQDIIDREIVEQYVLHKLSSDDRRGFQEHLFECDACFAEAQRLSGTLARVRHAGARGALDPVAARSAFSWLPPMFAFSIAACFLLAVVAVALFIVNGRLRAEVAAEQEARRSQNQAQSEFETARREAEQKLRASETDRDNLQQQLDEIKGNKPSR